MPQALIVFFLLTLAVCAQAKEGFREDLSKLPPAVKRWQDRVFMVSIHGYPWGTAFLVHSEPGKLHFLTAKHVAERCNVGYKCTLDQNALKAGRHAETTSTQSLEILARNVVVFEPAGEEWRNTGLEGTDIGYFTTKSFTGAPEARIDELTKPPLAKLPTNEVVAQRHFILGYPHLTSRPSLDTDENQVFRLRWSEGDRILKDPIPGGGTRVLANADSLGGNSGGPVIREDGSLLGILYGGPTGTAYAGDGSFHSYFIPLEYVRVFIKAIETNHPSAHNACAESKKAHCLEGR